MGEGLGLIPGGLGMNYDEFKQQGDFLSTPDSRYVPGSLDYNSELGPQPTYDADGNGIIDERDFSLYHHGGNGIIDTNDALLNHLEPGEAPHEPGDVKAYEPLYVSSYEPGSAGLAAMAVLASLYDAAFE